jgi:hypothetical protein
MIRVEDIRGFVTCFCDAETSIEFYRGEELAATLGVLNGSSPQTFRARQLNRWRKPGAGAN